MINPFNKVPEDYEICVGGVYLLVRRDSHKNWQQQNPVLGSAELGYDYDHRAFKRGDGETPWRKLPWFAQVVQDGA